MKENAETVLLGRRVVLVPYARKHVPKYHEWMSDAELRGLTASEPLTLEEEYDMQHAWQQDEDKLTFIVLARESQDQLPNAFDTPHMVHLSPEDSRIATLPMVGDVNLFLKGARPKKNFRRKGLALEAILLLLTYTTGQPSFLTTIVSPERLVSRISDANEASIHLFEKLGFAVVKRVAVFHEVEMRWKQV
ncbi:N-acetyltransferase 9 [Leucoagaricus sp. SymC.cos]|nr:N-acetyltransferase 9 [Leucoagaricus sp. SymC.cos]